MKTLKKKPLKLLSLFLSVLLVFGAFPVIAFAAVAPTVTEWPTITGRTELMFEEPVSVLTLEGGKADVPGEFSFPNPNFYPARLGEFKVMVCFTPTDNINYTVKKGPAATKISVVQSTAARVEGTVSATVPAGQKLSEAEIVKSDDFAMVNFNTKHSCTINWGNPDKIMDKAGSFEEKVIIAASDKGEDLIKPVEIMVTVTVEGDASETVVVSELPKASQINVGQKLADSKLEGGLVTKGGNPVAGTFAWQNSNISPTEGTRDYTVVFTPNDTAVCEPMEMQVSVTTVLPEMKLTWPEVKGHYKANAVVKDCVTLTGGEANIEGEFRITEKSKYMRIPASITESMDIELVFLPKDTVNYVKQNKTVTVSFEPAEPNCEVGVRVSSDKRSYEINAFLKNDENWGIHTGKLYLVLDGGRIELGEAFNTLNYDYTTLAAGTHTIQAVYEPGENDVYVKGESEIVEFATEEFYSVNVTDYAGTTSQDYLPGKTVTVTAQPHEKSYYDFTGWTAEGITLTEEESAQQTLTFEMPENEVNLTSNYKFNFCNFVKAVFEKIGQVLLGIINQGIAWLKDAIQNIPRP